MDSDIPDRFSGWSDEDAIYEAECIEIKPVTHTQRIELYEALPEYREGAVKSWGREGSSSGLNIYQKEQSNCNVLIDRLVWVDGWRQEGGGQAMTLVVLKLGIKPQVKNARVSYASLGLRLKSDKKEDEDPKLVAWGPFRRPEMWNVTPAHKRSNVSPSLSFTGGGGGMQASLGVNIEKEINWDENYTDYGLSAETRNGVLWQVFENKLLRRGITPEVRVAALFSRPLSEKYRVEVNVVVDTGAASQAKYLVESIFRRGGDRVYWSVETRPGLKDNYNGEGENIIKQIDPDNLGGIVDPRDSTNLDPEWLNKWDRLETKPPQALTELTKTEKKPAAGSSSSWQEEEQPTLKKEESSQDAVRHQVSQEHPYDSTTGVSRLASGGAADVPPRLPGALGAPGVGTLDVPTAPLPDAHHDSRLVALEDRAARAETRIAEQDRLIFELQQTLTRVAQALLPAPILTGTRSSRVTIN